MSAERPEHLERVAGAVSDGSPVDWEREKTASPELSEELFHLSQLEKLAEAHGGVASTSDAITQSAGSAVAEEPDEPVLPIRWDRLQVLAKVGEGSGGKVYRAFDPTLQMEV